MKTFVTVVGGIFLAVSCVTASDARPQPNREGPTQSEPPYSDADYSQRNTRNWDNSCLHSVPAIYWCSSNGG